MSYLLRSATVSAFSRATLAENLSTARRAMGPTTGRAPCHQSFAPRPKFCKAHTEYLTTRSANVSAEDSASSTGPSEVKKMSRKQRRHNSKGINHQRIDKVLAHRGVGTRSQTFELAKAKRIRYA